DEIIYKYKLRACYNIGRIQFKYRIFIPIIINNQTVCYTARDVTNSREPRYLNCPNQNAITPIKNCLYNIDTVADKMIIVEGPFDVLRIGDGCVATFGTEFTEKQIKTIAELKLKKITIIFDIDAQKQAVNLRKYLYSFCNDVEIFKINVKDPAELNINSVGEIRKRFLRTNVTK
ncbi:MAG: toprim domain-containing protein, partial [Gammaproteobacteria bacterium]|nr:toprim domain-containing protein [Gammaproteobacteria bacterium]